MKPPLIGKITTAIMDAVPSLGEESAGLAAQAALNALETPASLMLHNASKALLPDYRPVLRHMTSREKMIARWRAMLLGAAGEKLPKLREGAPPTPLQPMSDPIEAIIESALTAMKVNYLVPGDGEAAPDALDFYVPAADMHIECKQFYSPRAVEQMSRHSNAILIQGVNAAAFFHMVAKS